MTKAVQVFQATFTEQDQGTYGGVFVTSTRTSSAQFATREDAVAWTGFTGSSQASKTIQTLVVYQRPTEA